MASMSEAVVKVRAELGNAVVVRPGDKLVIARTDRLTHEQASVIRTALAERLPGVDIILVDECSGLAVYRDEQPDDKAIEQWIMGNPKAFENWFERQSRIRGTRIGHSA